jgi:hypothetical protein
MLLRAQAWGICSTGSFSNFLPDLAVLLNTISVKFANKMFKYFAFLFLNKQKYEIYDYAIRCSTRHFGLSKHESDMDFIPQFLFDRIPSVLEIGRFHLHCQTVTVQQSLADPFNLGKFVGKEIPKGIHLSFVEICIRFGQLSDKRLLDS